MIDCICGTTVLNTDELEAHIINRAVIHHENPDDHRMDPDGPTVFYQ